MLQQSYFGIYNQRKWNQYVEEMPLSSFLLQLFAIPKTWKQPTCPSTDKYYIKLLLASVKIKLQEGLSKS